MVLDFFLGSGTSTRLLIKWALKYIGIEQLNKHIDISFRRLNKVLQGEQSGTSKRNNWRRWRILRLLRTSRKCKYINHKSARSNRNKHFSNKRKYLLW
ncbi:site-specific DNA-methyltransferase [Mycoplasmopsis cynos]|uniref:hypothetical protein n=1 Tax=Mycoplasmopsis cynos TaxID=171284 RepID=UPI0024CB5EE7|nr:hypothetical protein [Mycoplasmopsis cynos]WAM09968.1 site-specific DNA-methyltransferase [Mycoplasmopsis cynos]